MQAGLGMSLYAVRPKSGAWEIRQVWKGEGEQVRTGVKGR